MLRIIGCMLAAFCAAQACGQGSPAQRLALTIYNDDLALVQDVRTIDFDAGRSRLEFKDVSDRIRPETVTLVAPGVSTVEQNFDFDLLTPAKLMEKAVGSQIQIVRTNPGSGQQTTLDATVLSVNGGVVLRFGNQIEVLRDDGLPTRVIFPSVPENLRARPTLSISVQSESADRREATLSYLTRGISWKADYVMSLNEAAGRIDLQGWVTLTNATATSFTQAQTQLVAGDVATRSYAYYNMARVNPLRKAGTETGGERRVADYYLYPLAERTTVASKQTKQVGFLDSNQVIARKAYEFSSPALESIDRPVGASVVVQFENSLRTGLGTALPAGVIRVYTADARGQPTFIGESRIPHTPPGSQLSVPIGEAFDVTAQTTLSQQERVGRTTTRSKLEYLLRNARPSAIEVTVRQEGLEGSRVLSENFKSTRLDAGSLQWTVPVPANGETALMLSVETRE